MNPSHLKEKEYVEGNKTLQFEQIDLFQDSFKFPKMPNDNILSLSVAQLGNLFILVTSVLNKRSSSSLNDKDRALRTQQTLTRVMNAEAAYLKQNGKYAGHVADLVPLAPKLQIDLTDGLANIQVDSSGDKTYYVQVTSTVLTFSRTVVDGKVVAKSCLQLKSAGADYCSRKTSKIKKSLPAS